MRNLRRAPTVWTAITERFAGLHAVARALIGYLSAVYDVDVDRDPAWAADLLGNVGTRRRRCGLRRGVPVRRR